MINVSTVVVTHFGKQNFIAIDNKRDAHLEKLNSFQNFRWMHINTSLWILKLRTLVKATIKNCY